MIPPITEAEEEGSNIIYDDTRIPPPFSPPPSFPINPDADPNPNPDPNQNTNPNSNPNPNPNSNLNTNSNQNSSPNLSSSPNPKNSNLNSNLPPKDPQLIGADAIADFVPLSHNISQRGVQWASMSIY